MKRKSWLFIISGLLLLAIVLLFALRRTPEPGAGEISPTPTVSPTTHTPTVAAPQSPTADNPSLLALMAAEDWPTVTPPATGEPTVPPEAMVMHAAPTATPGTPPPLPPAPTLTPYPTPLPTPTSVSSTGHDDVPMIEIPAGEFIMGSTFEDATYRSWVYVEEERVWMAPFNHFIDETPQMVVYLDTFEIDQVEVSNTRYQNCVNAGICLPEISLDLQHSHYPAIVSWYSAYTYCQWVNKRLPTEAEWEKAARGANGQRYPWGAQWPPVNEYSDKNLSPTGSFPQDTSPYGVLDMAGNAGEWTLDTYQNYLGFGQLKLGFTPAFRVVRGYNIDNLSQLSSRNPTLPHDANYGFRCMRSRTLLELKQMVISISENQVLSPTTTDLSRMTYIPTGEFIMGTDIIYDPEDESAHRDEQPAHIVFLDAFYIDRYPVTYAQFVDFLGLLGTHLGTCSSARCAYVVEEWEEKNLLNLHIYKRNGNYIVEEGYENHPVQNVTWEGAQAYCLWLGKRLPSEAEWEKAARGTDGRRYPWGNEWDERIYEVYEHEIGLYSFDASPYGLHDLLGNGFGEYVADWYALDYYEYSPAYNPTGPENGEHHVTRGGGGVYAIWGVTNRQIDNGGGFRCAYSIP